jgi:hypothetical protein
MQALRRLKSHGGRVAPVGLPETGAQRAGRRPFAVNDLRASFSAIAAARSSFSSRSMSPSMRSSTPRNVVIIVAPSTVPSTTANEQILDEIIARSDD